MAVKKILKKITSRNDGQSCLCISLNLKVKKSKFIKLIISTLFGFPIYIWSLVALFTIAATVAIGVLSYYCVPKEVNSSYFATCSSNKECNTVIGLHCASQDDSCNCPAKYTKGHCDCSSGYYWTGRRCVALLQHGQLCAADYNCDQSQDLKCVNKTCSCAAPKIWNATLNYCDYIFLGCFIDNANGLTWPFRAQSTNRMFYFVDLCLDYCLRFNRKYAGVTIAFGIPSNNLCACFNTISTATSTQCDIICLGTNGQYYPCGIFAGYLNTNYRAYYQVA